MTAGIAHESRQERELLASHIEHVRERLARIQGDRATLVSNYAARTADLADEEQTLELLLADLRERAMRANSLPSI
jgi:predicted  nucleic acid-binding Zn-ribbon protein